MNRPKLSKKALAVLGNSESSKKGKVSATTEEFLEDGTIDEESGDRWLSSDFAKALRFYQKAYTSYRKASSIPTNDKALLLDTYYNAARLLFSVHIQYMKTDGVDVNRLANIGEVLTGDTSSVLQGIDDIVAAHETALQIDPLSPPLDLQYNAALVYTEAIEESETLHEETVYKAMALFQEVLRRQVSEFQEFLRFMLEPEAASVPDASVPAEDQQFSSSKTTQPPDILTTVISAYGLIQAILESVSGSSGELESAVSLVSVMASSMNDVAAELIEKYSTENNQQTDLVASIEDEQLHEYQIIKASCQALSSYSLSDVYDAFSSGLPDTPERYMSAADAVDTYLERLDVPRNPQAIDTEVYWSALTNMNNNFKKAQDLLNADLQKAKSNLSDRELGLGSLIAQICKVYIARADVDLQRSQLDSEVAKKNSTVLFNNAKAFLKNAMNLSKTSGGIREKVVEKAQRERRRCEAVSRLCVLENTLDEAELNKTIGPGLWEPDLANYREFWYFQKFFS